MWHEKFTYLALMIGSVLFPFLLSFDKKVSFYRKWKLILFSILLPAIFFIVWDSIFTHAGIWSFNENFTIGLKFLELPIEEWLFFFVVPYCSLFIYEVLKYYYPTINYNKRISSWLCTLSVVFLVVAILNLGKWYTFYNLLFNAIFLFIILISKDFQKNLTHFILAYLIACVPMLIVNGVLTALPVVEYNSLYFSNLRLYTIPIEDFSYFLLLFSMNVFVFERLKVK